MKTKKTKVVGKKPVVKFASVTWDSGDGNHGAEKDLASAILFTMGNDGKTKLIGFSPVGELREASVCALARISAKLMEMEGYAVDGTE